jgi:hypothetical protein
MKTNGEVDVCIYVFLIFGTRWGVSGQLYALAVLPPEKSPRYPLFSGGGGHKSGLGVVEKRKIF